MKIWLRVLTVAMVVGVLGCGGEPNKEVSPSQVNEEERQKFKEEEKNVADLESKRKRS